MSTIKEAAAALSGSPDLNFDIINSHIQLMDDAEKDIASLYSGSREDTSIFINIQPVSFEPRKLHGSSVRTQQAYQMSVTKAVKNDDGEWVPDEKQTIARFLMSKRTLSSAMFTQNRFEPLPITITELDSVPVEQHDSFYDRRKMYGKNHRRTNKIISNTLAEAKEAFAVLGSGELSFSKANTSKVMSSLDILLTRANADLDWELTGDAETLDQDLYEARKEIEDRITSHLIKTDKRITVEHKTNNTHCRIQSYFDLHTNTDSFSELAKLLNKYIETLNTDDDQAISELKRKAESFNNHYIIKQKSTCDLSHGVLSFSKVQSTGIDLFGENKRHSAFFEMRIDFGSESQRQDGDITYNEGVALMNIQLSPYQLMSLVQCSLTGTWIKGTLSRFCHKGAMSDINYHDQKDFDLNVSFDSSLKTTITELINEAKQLLGKSSTKTNRARLVAIGEQLDELFAALCKEKAAAFENHQTAMVEHYTQKHLKEVDSTLKAISAHHDGFSPALLGIATKD